MVDLSKLYTSLQQSRLHEEGRREELAHLVKEMKLGLENGASTGDPLHDYLIRYFDADPLVEACLAGLRGSLKGKRGQLCLNYSASFRREAIGGGYSPTGQIIYSLTLRISLLTGEMLEFVGDGVVFPTGERVVELTVRDDYCHRRVVVCSPFTLARHRVLPHAEDWLLGRKDPVEGDRALLDVFVIGDDDVARWFKACVHDRFLAHVVDQPGHWVANFRESALALGYPKDKVQALLA